MPTVPDNENEFQKTIATLKEELAQTAATDTTKRAEIQSQIDDAEARLKKLQQAPTSDAKIPDRPDGQFFNRKELVEMAIVGGGGALGGLLHTVLSRLESGILFRKLRVHPNASRQGLSPQDLLYGLSPVRIAIKEFPVFSSLFCAAWQAFR